MGRAELTRHVQIIIDHPAVKIVCIYLYSAHSCVCKLSVDHHLRVLSCLLVVLLTILLLYLLFYLLLSLVCRVHLL